jgi:hypothetical protein
MAESGRSDFHQNAAPVSCPPWPVLDVQPVRAKVLVILEPDAPDRQMWVEGWAQINGPWVLFLDDADSHWVSWPLQHIRCVEWTLPLIEERP